MRGLGFDKPLSGNDTFRTNILQTIYNAIIKDKGATRLISCPGYSSMHPSQPSFTA